MVIAWEISSAITHVQVVAHRGLWAKFWFETTYRQQVFELDPMLALPGPGATI